MSAIFGNQNLWGSPIAGNCTAGDLVPAGPSNFGYKSTSAINIPAINHRKGISSYLIRCVAYNCNRILKKHYNKRCRLCADHLTASELHIDGTIQRFCQKCGKTHPLHHFEALKRSCRAGLERHNIRQKALRSLKAHATSPNSSNGSLTLVAPQPADFKAKEAVSPRSVSLNSNVRPGQHVSHNNDHDGYLIHLPQKSPFATPVAAAAPWSQTAQRRSELSLDEYLLSSRQSDKSLVDWLLFGQDFPPQQQQQQQQYNDIVTAQLPPVIQLPEDFFS